MSVWITSAGAASVGPSNDQSRRGTISPSTPRRVISRMISRYLIPAIWQYPPGKRLKHSNFDEFTPLFRKNIFQAVTCTTHPLKF
jgi:hypothetical protein